MSFSYKGNVINENAIPYTRMSYASYLNNQQRQFGKEISNVSTRHNQDIQPFKVNLHRSKSQSIKLDNVRCRASSQINTSKMEEEIPCPQLVNLYVLEIFDHLQSNQHKSMCSTPYYMNYQQDINGQMRSILIDWLIDVHLKFKLLPETLFLTINLIDRYLSKNAILRSKLQLVGVSSLFIACKYEEIYAPELKDFVYVCDHAYNKEEILEMEGRILQTVQFNLIQMSPLRFLERQVCGGNLCEKVSCTAKMILELGLLDLRALKYSPSIQATTAILLSINMLKSPQILPQSLHYIDNQEELKQCLQDYLPIIQLLSSSNLSSVRRKYQHEKYLKVSELVLSLLNNKTNQNNEQLQ